MEDTEAGLSIGESHAIIKYLAKKFKTQENWYPHVDLKRAAKIDEYLDLHHTVTRKIANLIFFTLFAPALGVKDPNFSSERAKKDATFALKIVENNYLSKSKYMIGDEISVADLSAYCEIEEYFMFLGQSSTPWPNVTRWMKLMGEIPQVKEYDDKLKKFV